MDAPGLPKRLGLRLPRLTMPLNLSVDLYGQFECLQQSVRRAD